MLKNNLKSDIYAWNKKLAADGELITKYRKNFFDKVMYEFKNLLEILEPKSVFNFFNLISIDFSCGWNLNNSLSFYI